MTTDEQEKVYREFISIRHEYAANPTSQQVNRVCDKFNARGALYNKEEIKEALILFNGKIRDELMEICNAIAKLQSPPRYETPEQYKKRTGKEWPRNWAVYYSTKYDSTDDWEVSTYSDILEIIKHSADDYVCEDIIVATELGRPPDGWTPEDEVRELS
jgi:hypothetical protein